MFNYPRLSTLTYLAFQVNTAIAEGHDNEFSFQEIYECLDHGSILQDLSDKLPDVFDLGLILMEEEQHRGLIDVLREASEAFKGRESRKAAVEQGGLTLLMAIALEALQQQSWTTPDLYPFSPKEFGSVFRFASGATNDPAKLPVLFKPHLGPESCSRN